LKGVLAALLMALAAPAMADDWGRYENTRFGYTIDVPPGFEGQGEADNGDGQVFSTPTAELRVYGGYILEGDFEDEVKALQQTAIDAGWTITYQAATPRWASYSGTQGSRIFYARAIALCDGAVAEFSLTYGKADLRAFDPIVERLVRSLKPAGSC
jgi:hypothetical protein